MRLDVMILIVSALVGIAYMFFRRPLRHSERLGKGVLRYYIDLIWFLILGFIFFYWLAGVGGHGNAATPAWVYWTGCLLFIAFLLRTLWLNIKIIRMELIFTSLFSGHTVFSTFILIIVIFASLFLLIYTVNEDSFAGLAIGSNLFVSYVDFLYLSVVTFATVGFGDIAPISVGAKLAVMLEIALFFFTIGAAGVTFTRRRDEERGDPLSQEERDELRLFMESASYRDLKRLRRIYKSEGLVGLQASIQASIKHR